MAEPWEEYAQARAAQAPPPAPVDIPPWEEYARARAAPVAPPMPTGPMPPGYVYRNAPIPMPTVTAPPERPPGVIGNLWRGVRESATEIAGDLARFIPDAGDALERKFPLGGFAIGGPNGWIDWQSAEESRALHEAGQQADLGMLLREGAREWQKPDYGYEPMTTTDEIKAALRDEGLLSAAYETGKWGLEQAVTSAPHVAAAVTPAAWAPYVASRTEGIATERAAARGSQDVTGADLGVSLPAAAISVALDRFGGLKSLAALTGPLEKTAIRRIMVAMAAEGITESSQEFTEYVATQIGQLPFDEKEALERVIFAGLGGAVGGGAMRTVIGEPLQALGGKPEAAPPKPDAKPPAAPGAPPTAPQALPETAPGAGESVAFRPPPIPPRPPAPPGPGAEAATVSLPPGGTGVPMVQKPTHIYESEPAPVPTQPAAEDGTIQAARVPTQPPPPATPPAAPPAGPYAAGLPPDEARIESPVLGGRVRGEAAQAATPELATERPPSPVSASQKPAAQPEPVIVDDARPYAEQGVTQDEFIERYGPQGVNESVGNDPTMAYRSMSEDEYNATVVGGKGVVSDGRWRATAERTNFGEDFATALHYQIGNRSDPRKTGKPVYVVEAPRSSLAPSKLDRGNFEGETSDVRRVWRVEANGQQLTATPVTAPTTPQSQNVTPAPPAAAPDTTAPSQEGAGPATAGAAPTTPESQTVTPEAKPETEPEVNLQAEAEIEQAAGAQYKGMYNEPGGPKPAEQPQTITLGKGARARTIEADAPKKDGKAQPIRRETVMDAFQRAFNIKVYQGRPFGIKRALGFFKSQKVIDPATGKPQLDAQGNVVYKGGEIRIKEHNELQVTAHEVFHWLDKTFPSLRNLYQEPRFDKELRGVSYETKLVSEGFAEFGRLYLTQETEAVQRTPTFYDEFIREAAKLGILDKLNGVQEMMHRWYGQGALNRALSKIGEQQDAGMLARISKEVKENGFGFRPIMDGIFGRHWDLRFVAGVFDYLHMAKVVEREITGGIAEDAVNSPYKSLRLLAGARATIETFLKHGTLKWTDKRDLDFSGKSFTSIWEPVADVFDIAMNYALGRRALELELHKKQSGFTPDEIKALLDQARKHPKYDQIKKAFQEWTEYSDRVLDFAVQSGVISQATVKLWREMYQNYVPMFRVADMANTVDPEFMKRPGVFKKFVGSDRSVNDIFENMTQNTAMIVEASLRNVAKRQLYETIQSSIKGQRFAVQIPAGTERRTVAMEQIKGIISKIAGKAAQEAQRPGPKQKDFASIAGLAGLLSKFDLNEVQDQAAVFFGGKEPGGEAIDSVLVDGKRVYFQVGDQLLWQMLQEINYHHAFGTLNRILGGTRKFITATVTRFPDFWVPNWIRDVWSGFTLSKGGQTLAFDALKALKDIYTDSPDFRLYLANSGGYGMNIRAAQAELRASLVKRGINVKDILDSPRAIADFLDKWGQPFELATRLAEFKKIRDTGKSMREGAFQGREISTDFAMRGRFMALRTILNTLPFMNARLQGLYRLEREIMERKGSQTLFRGDRALKYAGRAALGITVPNLLAYFLFNRDDEDYDDLPLDVRAQYTVLPSPDGDGFYLVPRAFETGAFFGYWPVAMAEAFDKETPKPLMDAFIFTFLNTFSFDPTPGVLRGAVSTSLTNRTWNGLPIVPESMKNVEPFLQYQPWTPEVYKRVGELFNVSPLKLEALSNSYLNNLGYIMAFSSDALLGSQTGEKPETPISQYPLLRRFFRREPLRRTQSEADFYDKYQEVNRVVASVKKLMDDGRGPELENYLGSAEREQLFALETLTKDVSAQSSVISKGIRDIQNSATMTSAQKREKMDQYETQRNEMFRDVVKKLNASQLEQYRDRLDRVPQ